jgi:hypothetical protein
MATKKPATKKIAAKPSKEEGARDRFGNRVGTQAAVINAALTAKPQTAAQVAETTGLNAGRIASHFKWLLDREHVVKTADGYAVKPAKKSSAKKT